MPEQWQILSKTNVGGGYEFEILTSVEIDEANKVIRIQVSKEFIPDDPRKSEILYAQRPKFSSSTGWTVSKTYEITGIYKSPRWTDLK